MAEVPIEHVGEDGLDDIRHVVLDTSCINKDYRLAAPETAFLIANARSMSYQLCVPDIVVVVEMVNHFREDLRTANENLGKALRALDHLTFRQPGSPLTESELATAVADFEVRFRALLATHGVYVEPLPADLRGVQRLLDRDLGRRKPFADLQRSPKDRSGLRDAPIWESVLELCRRDPRALVIISTNTSDFADNSKTQLHQHLLDDLQEIGIESLTVSFFPSIQAFNDARLRIGVGDAVATRGVDESTS